MEYSAFAFLAVLVAVVNGLAIVHILNVIVYAMRQENFKSLYWVHGLWIAFQLLNHITLWWAIWSLQNTTQMDFFKYLYLLCGPLILFLATNSLIATVPDGQRFDTTKIFNENRKLFFSLWITYLLWSIFTDRLFLGEFHESVWIQGILFAVMLGGRMSDNTRIQGAVAVSAMLILLVLIGSFALELGQF